MPLSTVTVREPSGSSMLSSLVPRLRVWVPDVAIWMVIGPGEQVVVAALGDRQADLSGAPSVRDWP